MEKFEESAKTLDTCLAHARAGGFVGSTDFQKATSRDKTALEVRFTWENTGSSETQAINFDHEYHRNQQYSVTAITNGSAGIVERYAYQAYGEPTILDASASVLSSSSISNRYTYTGREWDGTVGLCHFRARWMSGLTGRFLSRDPIGYAIHDMCLYQYVHANPHGLLDPTGNSWFAASGAVQRNPRHHWFMAHHRRRGYGQMLVNQKCRCPWIDINRFTTEYTVEEHEWIHANVGGGDTMSPFDSYASSYEAMLITSTTCCDFLVRTYALMLAWHSAVRVAIANDYLPDRELPPFDLFPYRPRQNEQSTWPEFMNNITIACGRQNQERTDLQILRYRDDFLRQIRERHGINRPRTFIDDLNDTLFPGGVVPIGPVLPRVPRIPIEIHIPVAA